MCNWNVFGTLGLNSDTMYANNSVHMLTPGMNLAHNCQYKKGQEEGIFLCQNISVEYQLFHQSDNSDMTLCIIN